MASFNSCTFTGRLGTDPEMRYFESGTAIASFRLAVDQPKRGKDSEGKTLWVTVNVWGKRAQVIADYAKKGSMILVCGQLGLEEWEKDGKTNSKLTLNCNEFTFIGGGKQGETGSAKSSGSKQSQRREPAPPAEDDDIPF